MLASTAAFSLASASRADQTYHVNFDTSSLPTGAGPYSIDFQLFDGGDLSNNTASITNFSFGTGSAPANDASVGGTGTFSGGIVAGAVNLADDFTSNEFYETFTPGNNLSFDVTLSTNVDSGPTSSPDEFTFSILDSASAPIPTLDPLGADTLAVVEISDTPTVTTFPTDPSRTLSDGITTLAIGAPTVTNPVPEASSFASLGLLLVGLGAFAVRRTRRAA